MGAFGCGPFKPQWPCSSYPRKLRRTVANALLPESLAGRGGSVGALAATQLARGALGVPVRRQCLAANPPVSRLDRGSDAGPFRLTYGLARSQRAVSGGSLSVRKVDPRY